MQFRRSLRFRIILSFVLFGALLSTAIGVGVYFAVEDIEYNLVEESMDEELRHFLANAPAATGPEPLRTAQHNHYRVPEGQRDSLPAFLRSLPPGHHEVAHEQNLYQVRVAQVRNDYVYVVKDATAFENRERALQASLVVAVLLAIGSALWLSFWLSRRVIAPVSNLARQVTALRTDSSDLPALSDSYPDDEVGELASAFDRYVTRIRSFMEREQEFTANASHELRTPLAVINGAAELLLENDQLTGQARRQVERIARAGAKMAQMLETLLILAREDAAGERVEERCSLSEVTLETVDSLRHMLDRRPVELRTELAGDRQLHAARTVVSIMIGNLLRNAIEHTQEGHIEVRVDDRSLRVADTGTGIAPHDMPHVFKRHYRGGLAGSGGDRSGSGLGLAIVQRICDRYHWQVRLQRLEPHGTEVTISFPDQ